MSRLPLLTPDELNDEQRAVRDGLMGGPRGANLANADGSLVGPFNALLHSPAIGSRMEQLGAAVRFSTSIENRLLELAIVITAREWSAQFEWWAHARLAAEAGIDQAIIDAIKERRQPTFANDDEATVYAFCRELLDTRRVSQATYDRARALLGDAGLVELVALSGYYGMVSMVLNAFEVPLPAGVEEPLTL